MSRPAGQIKTGQVAGTIAWLEGAEKTTMAGQSVDGAVENPVSLVDIGRCQCGLEDDMLLHVGHSGAPGELIKDDTAIPRQHPLPVMVRPQIWRVHQDVNRVPARRSNRWIGASRCRDIAGWIRGWFPFAVDPIEFLLGIGGKDKVMVGQLLINPVKPEIQN